MNLPQAITGSQLLGTSPLTGAGILSTPLTGSNLLGTTPTASTAVPTSGALEGPAKPTTVVTSTPKAITTAQNAVTTSTQNQTAAQIEAKRIADLDAQTLSTDRFLKGSNKPNPNYIQPITPVPNTDPVKQAQTDAILHEGETKFYNQYTGKEEWLPTTSTPPSGYSTLDPKTRTDVSNSIQDAEGNVIKQFSDGTYARIDASGNYTLGSEQMFKDATRVKEIGDALDNARKGIYSSTQQMQLDNMMNDYNELIRKQSVLNANTTGGTTIAMARSGLGNQVIGQQQIDKTINDGISAISKLTAQRDSAIAKMKEAFEQDDMLMLEKAFNLYSKTSDDIQKNIDKIGTIAESEKNKQELKTQDYALSQMKKYPDAGISQFDTAEEISTKLKNNPKFQQDNQLQTQLSPDDWDWYSQFQLTGAGKSLGNIGGYGKDGIEMKRQFIKSMKRIADQAGLSPEQLGTSLTDKTSAAKTYTKLQQQQGLLESQESATLKDFDLLIKNGEKMSASDWKSGVPWLQNYIRTGEVKFGDNDKVNNYMGNLVTTLTKYARVVYGQTGAAGVTQGANDEIQKILRPGLSLGSVKSYIENVAKPEMDNTIKGYHEGLSRMNDIMNISLGNTSSPLGGTDLLTGGTPSSAGSSNNDPAGLGI